MKATTQCIERGILISSSTCLKRYIVDWGKMNIWSVHTFTRWLFCCILTLGLCTCAFSLGIPFFTYEKGEWCIMWCSFSLCVGLSCWPGHFFILYLFLSKNTSPILSHPKISHQGFSRIRFRFLRQWIAKTKILLDDLSDFPCFRNVCFLILTGLSKPLSIQKGN